jgi:hypothetical protein
VGFKASYKTVEFRLVHKARRSSMGLYMSLHWYHIDEMPRLKPQKLCKACLLILLQAATGSKRDAALRLSICCRKRKQLWADLKLLKTSSPYQWVPILMMWELYLAAERHGLDGGKTEPSSQYVIEHLWVTPAAETADMTRNVVQKISKLLRVSTRMQNSPEDKIKWRNAHPQLLFARTTVK